MVELYNKLSKAIDLHLAKLSSVQKVEFEFCTIYIYHEGYDFIRASVYRVNSVTYHINRKKEELIALVIEDIKEDYYLSETKRVGVIVDKIADSFIREIDEIDEAKW